jgi:predicted ATP-binding protein involved in virulence
LVVLIDEGETYFHPAWQREFFYDILLFFKKLFITKTIQLVITSNSPFIASDLPKSMINFLDRDENGNCIVVDGLNQSKQTFASNIHTLYTEAFFMPNSLVGTFAKSKIDKLIKIINKEVAFDEEFKDLAVIQKYIDIVGEPILRSLLQRQIDSLRIEGLDNVQERLDDLENRLRDLEKEEQ